MYCRSLRLSRRPGTVLIYFALIVFAVMAMAALVVDLGFVRVTQRQMQTAVDAAALEGLWNNSNGTAAAEQAAQTMMNTVFTDEVDSQGNVVTNFGAGPSINFTPGTGDANALQTMSVPSPPVYKPQLQANSANQLNGDVVTGTFAQTFLTVAVQAGDISIKVDSALGFNSSTYVVRIENEALQVSGGSGSQSWMVQRGFGGTTAAAHPVNATVTLVDLPTEDGSYNRNDFINQANSNSGTAVNNAFLVRLRRTRGLQGNDTNPLDDASGVSSSGNALPLLFGRATMLASPTSGISPRRDGIKVRATAVAAGRRAVTAGSPFPGAQIRGLAPFALQQSTWESFTSTLQLNFLGSGAKQPGTTPGDILANNAPPPVGQVFCMTYLTAPLTAQATTVQVNSAVGFPASGTFRILVDDGTQAELMQVVSGAGSTTWTVQRGLGGQSQAAFTATSTIVTLFQLVQIGQSLLNTKTQPSASFGTFLGSQTAPNPTVNDYCFIPIYATSGANQNLIIGFGYATMAFNGSGSGGGAGGGTKVIITKQAAVGAGNVSATFAVAPPSASFLSALQPLGSPLLAPALVR